MDEQQQHAPAVQMRLLSDPRALEYSADGRLLVSAESEGIVRLFQARSENRNEDPQLLQNSENFKPVAVACHSAFVAVASEASVHLFDAKTYFKKTTVTRLTLPVRAVAFSACGSKIACGSSDHIVRVVQALDDGSKAIDLQGHSADVTGVHFDPQGKYLASIACDGQLCLWNLEKQKLLQKFNIAKRTFVSETLESALTQPRVRWSPTGTLVCSTAGSFENTEIAVITCTYAADNTLQAKFRATFKEHKGAITSFAWSPNGEVIASVGKDCALILWSATSMAVLHETKFTSVPAHVSWHPELNTIAVSFVDKTVQVFDNLVRFEIACEKKIPNVFSIPPPPPKIPSQLTSPMLLPSKIPKLQNLGQKQNGNDLLGLFDDKVQKQKEVTPVLLKKNESLVSRSYLEDVDQSDLDDFIVPDTEDEDENEAAKSIKKEKKTDPRNDKISIIERQGAASVHSQPVFQPGASDSLGDRYYLVLNAVGAVYVIDQSVHVSVHIELHDRAAHLPVQFTDSRKFTLGTLTPRLAAFACAGDTSTATPASLHCRLLNVWCERNTWTVSLGSDDLSKPVGLAASRSGLLVLVTLDNTARVFSPGGQFLHAFTAPGRFICLSANGATASSEDLDVSSDVELNDSEDDASDNETTVSKKTSRIDPDALVYGGDTNEPGYDDGDTSLTFQVNHAYEQNLVNVVKRRQSHSSKDLAMLVFQSSGDPCCLETLVYDLREFCQALPFTKIAITPGARLTWCGFSELGVPYTYDSFGVLRAGLMPPHLTWSPVLHTRNSGLTQSTTLLPSNAVYFAVGVMNHKFLAIAVPCSATQVQGSATTCLANVGFPRPPMSQFDFSVPAFAASSDMSQSAAASNAAWVASRTAIRLDRGWRNRTAAELKRSREALYDIDRSGLQQVLAAVKSGFLQRALDIARALETAQSVEAAEKIAEYHEKRGLSERVYRLAEARHNRAKQVQPTTLPKTLTRKRSFNADAGSNNTATSAPQPKRPNLTSPTSSSSSSTLSTTRNTFVPQSGSTANYKNPKVNPFALPPRPK